MAAELQRHVEHQYSIPELNGQFSSLGDLRAHMLLPRLIGEGGIVGAVRMASSAEEAAAECIVRRDVLWRDEPLVAEGWRALIGRARRL